MSPDPLPAVWGLVMSKGVQIGKNAYLVAQAEQQIGKSQLRSRAKSWILRKMCVGVLFTETANCTLSA